MLELRTEKKIFVCSVAAIGVPLLVAAAGYLAVRAVERRLDQVSDSQFPIYRALAEVQGGFQQANSFLSHQALSRLTDAVLQTGDCQVCHGAQTIFKDHGETALAAVDAASARVDALPPTEASRKLWPDTKKALDEWRTGARGMQALLQERQKLVDSHAAPQKLQEVETKVFAHWEQLHQLADPLDASIGKLSEALRAETQASREQSKQDQRRQLLIQGILLAGASISMVIGGWLIARNLNRGIVRLVGEAGKLTQAATRGELDVRGEIRGVPAEFQPIVTGMNETMGAFAAPIRMTADCVTRVSMGEVPPPITSEYEGEFRVIRDSLNGLIAAVKMRDEDLERLIASALAGDLEDRADVTKYKGANGKVLAGINAVLDAMVAPVREATTVLEQLSLRDLRARMCAEYQGDHARLETAVNAAAQALHDAIAQVSQSASKASETSKQIADLSQAVASGASQQASALEEASSSLETMSSSLQNSAENVQKASALVESTRTEALEGVDAMREMTGAMVKIRASAESTSQIIKDINEIAFQTNLLALNAAVEAARAGEAGRGFSVVAEEVRSLAMRAKEAANRTEELIRESVNQTGEGDRAAAFVKDKLQRIVGKVEGVTGIVSEITAAVRDNAGGITQITTAVAEVNTVTQKNAASSEETSLAADELSTDAAELAAMVNTFQLEDGNGAAQPPAGIHIPPSAQALRLPPA